MATFRLVTASGSASGDDLAMQQATEALGHTLGAVVGQAVDPAGATEGFILIAPSVSPSLLHVGYRTLAKPLLCAVGTAWDELGLTSVAGSSNTTASDVYIFGDHALNAGLALNTLHVIYTANGLRYRGNNGDLTGSNAIRIGSMTSNTGLDTLFAYESGVVMKSAEVAPARRYGWGLAAFSVRNATFGSLYSQAVGFLVGSAANSAPTATINEADQQLEVGQTYQYTGAVTDPEDGALAGTWSSSDQAVATVSSTGLVTAVALGSATITLSGTDSGTPPLTGSASRTVDVVANAPPVITWVAPPAGDVASGTKIVVEATANDSTDGPRPVTLERSTDGGATRQNMGTAPHQSPQQDTVTVTTTYYATSVDAAGASATSTRTVTVGAGGGGFNPGDFQVHLFGGFR